ncbi:MAG: galactokinase [Jatrophihabitans sp.]
MTARWRAPGRVNLIGEHTDYNGGFVLPLAITQGCTAEVRRNNGSVLRIESAQRTDVAELPLDELVPGRVDGWASYPAGSVWALCGAGHELGGMTVHIDGDVPSGAGLSSSAAVVCSVAAAVADEFLVVLDADEIVTLSRQAENDFVGAPTGGMDQLASVKCEAGHVLLCDMRSLATEPVPFDLAAAGLRLLVIDTRAEHGHVGGEYGDRRAACEQAAHLLGVDLLRDVTDLSAAEATLRAANPGDDTLLRRARHVITENARVLQTAELLRAGRVADIGGLLVASHESMRDDFEITVAEVDVAMESAMVAGALGARMTGGGFGGCVIALAPTETVPRIEASVEAAFAERDFRTPASFRAVAGPGAHRLDG